VTKPLGPYEPPPAPLPPAPEHLSIDEWDKRLARRTADELDNVRQARMFNRPDRLSPLELQLWHCPPGLIDERRDKLDKANDYRRLPPVRRAQLKARDRKVIEARRKREPTGSFAVRDSDSGEHIALTGSLNLPRELVWLYVTRAAKWAALVLGGAALHWLKDHGSKLLEVIK
jgi:hypothetical protein